MSSFIESPLLLAQDAVIRAKVAAINNRGQSEISDQSTETSIIVQDKPYKMTTLASGTDTTHQQIHLTWSAVEAP